MGFVVIVVVIVVVVVIIVVVVFVVIIIMTVFSHSLFFSRNQIDSSSNANSSFSALGCGR